MRPRERLIAIVTPSYAPDLELCIDLNETVKRFTGPDVTHTVIVPDRDREAFEVLSSDRTAVRTVRAFLPRSMIKVPGVNMWANLRCPLPPIRGWVAQQIVKLAAAAESPADIVLLVDSDVLFIQPIDSASFESDGCPQLFRVPDAVDASMPRHVLWHRTARQLLGLPQLSAATLPDYICWPCAWQPSIVRAMLERVEAATGMRWQTAIGRKLHFSEMILYGVFVDEFIFPETPIATTTQMRCVNHSEEVPLDQSSLRALLDQASADDIAVMVSAKSGTPLDVRRSLLSGFHAPKAP